MTQLVDADRGYRDRQPLVPAERGAEWAPRSFWQTGRSVDFGSPVAAGADVPAYVNHGRWVVECPDCRGAQLACEQDRRFMCNTCGNESIGGRWRAVVWPPFWQGLESVLIRRPDPVTRNWLPGESVADLASENDDHGVVDR